MRKLWWRFRTWRRKYWRRGRFCRCGGESPDSSRRCRHVAKRAWVRRGSFRSDLRWIEDECGRKIADRRPNCPHTTIRSREWASRRRTARHCVGCSVFLGSHRWPNRCRHSVWCLLSWLRGLCRSHRSRGHDRFCVYNRLWTRTRPCGPDSWWFWPFWADRVWASLWDRPCCRTSLARSRWIRYFCWVNVWAFRSTPVEWRSRAPF